LFYSKSNAKSFIYEQVTYSTSFVSQTIILLKYIVSVIQLILLGFSLKAEVERGEFIFPSAGMKKHFYRLINHRTDPYDSANFNDLFPTYEQELELKLV
jgi:hypothetical protein